MLRTGVLAGAIAVGLAACGSTKWGFPYRADVQQGNWITSEQVAQLQRGMTREQVRFILGTPTLQDVFRSDRWDYPYYNKPGYGKEQERKFTVWFEGDTLVRWEGDEQPDRQPFQKADTGMTKPEGTKAAEDTSAQPSPVAPETQATPEAASGAAPVTPSTSGQAGAATEQPVPADTTPSSEASGPTHRAILNTRPTPPAPNPGVPAAGRSAAEPLR